MRNFMVVDLEATCADDGSAPKREMESWMYGPTSFTFCSWGDYDQRQFHQNSDYQRIPYPMPGEHINLKRAFSQCQAMSKKLGMAGAMEAVGLEIAGTHHRGIDDTRNIARLLPWCIEADER